jgi:hypothetical protein
MTLASLPTRDRLQGERYSRRTARDPLKIVRRRINPFVKGVMLLAGSAGLCTDRLNWSVYASARYGRLKARVNATFVRATMF